LQLRLSYLFELLLREGRYTGLSYKSALFLMHRIRFGEILQAVRQLARRLGTLAANAILDKIIRNSLAFDSLGASCLLGAGAVSGGGAPEAITGTDPSNPPKPIGAGLKGSYLDLLHERSEIGVPTALDSVSVRKPPKKSRLQEQGQIDPPSQHRSRARSNELFTVFDPSAGRTILISEIVRGVGTSTPAIWPNLRVVPHLPSLAWILFSEEPN
jgi:hypothetical protein